MKIVFCAFLLLWSGTVIQAQKQTSAVRDPETAIKIAEAALIPVYGKKTIISERPFTAVLEDGVWTVSGTLHCKNDKEACDGGVSTVRLSKADGRIISMGHGK